jgi:hypothetical protein
MLAGVVPCIDASGRCTAEGAHDTHVCDGRRPLGYTRTRCCTAAAAERASLRGKLHFGKQKVLICQNGPTSPVSSVV